jgi:hypothetical protein
MSTKLAILTFVSAYVLLGCSNAPARRAAPDSTGISGLLKTVRQYPENVPTAEQSVRIRKLLRDIRGERP